MVVCQKFVQYIGMLCPGRFILIATVCNEFYELMAQYFCYDPEQDHRIFETGSGSIGIDPVLLLFLQ